MYNPCCGGIYIFRVVNYSIIGFKCRTVVGNASRFATAPDVTQIKHYHTYVVCSEEMWLTCNGLMYVLHSFGVQMFNGSAYFGMCAHAGSGAPGCNLLTQATQTCPTASNPRSHVRPSVLENRHVYLKLMRARYVFGMWTWFMECSNTRHAMCDELVFWENIYVLFCNQAVRNNAPTRGVPGNTFDKTC